MSNTADADKSFDAAEAAKWVETRRREIAESGEFGEKRAVLRAFDAARDLLKDAPRSSR